MRITGYRTELGEDRVNRLVRELDVEYEDGNIDTAEKAAALLNAVFDAEKLAEEHLYIIALSIKNRVLGIFDVSHGSADMAVVHPREVFIRLLLVGASRFVMAHNHPSGDSAPSREDMIITKRIKECAELMGVGLLDHVIIGEHVYSFKEKNML